jgi:hypothetical protein
VGGSLLVTVGEVIQMSSCVLSFGRCEIRILEMNMMFLSKLVSPRIRAFCTPGVIFVSFEVTSDVWGHLDCHR